MPKVYKRKLDTYDPGIPIKFLIWLLLLVRKELSLMLKLNKDSAKIIEIKKEMPYEYFKIFLIYLKGNWKKFIVHRLNLNICIKMINKIHKYNFLIVGGD